MLFQVAKPTAEQGRYTWRHDFILCFVAMTFQSVRDSMIYVDFPGFISHFAITGDNLRPDLRLVLLNVSAFLNLSGI